MPHAVEQDDDDDLIKRVLGGEEVTELDDFHNRDLELGEKADDALDFGDISDDDLPDEEHVSAESTQQVGDGVNKEEDEDQNGLFETAATAGNDPFDDLFGSAEEPQSPIATVKPDPDASRHSSRSAASSVLDEGLAENEVQENDLEDGEDDFEDDPEYLEQMRLFEEARRDREDRTRRGESYGMPPPAPWTDAELFSIIWPQYEPGKPPRFGELLPGKRAQYLAKTPLKPPKPVHPTKVNLELQQDQEKSFRLAASNNTTFEARRAEAEANGLVLTGEGEHLDESSADELDNEDMMDTSQDGIGNIGWQDLVAVCQDWDVPSEDGGSVNGDLDMFDIEEDPDQFATGDVSNSQATKKRKLNDSKPMPLQLIHNVNALLDDPEKATAKLARRVNLDMNDPHMLIDVQDPSSVTIKKRKFGAAYSRNIVGNLTKDLSRRYNISNDEAYDLLKENHQSKIRSNLGDLELEHALPAVLLQYPAYKIALSKREARYWHRPKLKIRDSSTQFFSLPRRVKRKHIKGKTPIEIFKKSQDLSVGDNSDVLLLEYSEECPPMMSNFGMQSRFINYYRRTDDHDTHRPKDKLGEASVLLPQDKSPFSIFGDVARGETVPTIRNAMYRAPVFEHSAKTNDFVVSRSTTGTNGSVWHLRNMDNLHVVGQEFPSVEVPGPNSRKTTDVAKQRLKMLAFRMYKKKKGKLYHNELMKHLPNSDAAQNRTKLKDYMKYDPPNGWMEDPKLAVIPDEAGIRASIKPEELCLLEGMQVGRQYLTDSGYGDKEMDDIAGDEDDAAKIDKMLAPWQTTKNFINACQGKAMLKLHGDGDPSTRGEAFNLIRTSMKGGFKALGESVEDRLDAQKQRDLGGHSYNVARQQAAYNETIRKVWDAQKRSLSSTLEHDLDMYDEENLPADERRTPAASRARTPSSAIRSARRDDESKSIMSRSSDAIRKGKILKITRTFKDRYGQPQTRTDVIDNPLVIRQYVKKRKREAVNAKSLDQLSVTGNEEYDKEQRKRIEEELARLHRNRDRRHAREKAKGIVPVSSPSADAGSPAGDSGDKPDRKSIASGTKRRCANCGQVGHIKTNRKECPMLNGEWDKKETGHSAFGTTSAPPAAPSGAAGSPDPM